MQKFCKRGVGGGGRTCPKAERNLLFLSLCRLLKGKCPCLMQQLGGNLVFKKRRGERGGGFASGGALEDNVVPHST